MAEETKRTEFSEIGVHKAIAQLFDGSGYNNVEYISTSDTISAHKVMMEGVDFDLTYNPIKHLGYKAALAVVGEIYAGFYSPISLSVVIGISSRFCFEDIEELWAGVVAASKEHGIKSLHLELAPSVNGLYISMCAAGSQKKKILKARPEVANMDLICLSGNVGAAYMGMNVLEREKRCFVDNGEQPDLSKYKYILAQYLCPEVPANVIDRFLEHNIVPSSGVFITKGLSDAVRRLCEKCNSGANIYVEKIPISSHTFEMAEELNMDALTAALNGGEDYRLLFTIPISLHALFKKEIQTFDVIGHLTPQGNIPLLITPDDSAIPMTSTGW